MAGANVNITVKTNAPQVSAGLKKLNDRYGNVSLALSDIGEHLKLSHFDRFRDQKSPDGDPWVALSEDYRKRKKKNQDRILTLEGFLGSTLRYQVVGKTLLFGTDQVYGATHQFGRGEIPARPFLGLSNSDEAEALRLVERHLASAL